MTANITPGTQPAPGWVLADPLLRWLWANGPTWREEMEQADGDAYLQDRVLRLAEEFDPLRMVLTLAEVTDLLGKVNLREEIDRIPPEARRKSGKRDGRGTWLVRYPEAAEAWPALAVAMARADDLTDGGRNDPGAEP